MFLWLVHCHFLQRCTLNKIHTFKHSMNMTACLLFSTHSKSLVIFRAPICGPQPLPMSQVLDISVPNSSGELTIPNSYGCLMDQVFLCFLTPTQSVCSASVAINFLLKSPTTNAIVSWICYSEQFCPAPKSPLKTCIFTSIIALSKERALLFPVLTP